MSSGISSPTAALVFETSPLPAVRTMDLLAHARAKLAQQCKPTRVDRPLRNMLMAHLFFNKMTRKATQMRMQNKRRRNSLKLERMVEKRVEGETVPKRQKTTEQEEDDDEKMEVEGDGEMMEEGESAESVAMEVSGVEEPMDQD